MRSRANRTTWVLAALGIMAIASRNVQWRDVAASLERSDPTWLAICIALVVVDRGLMAWRCVALLRVIESAPPLSLSRVLRLFFISSFVGTFLPGGIGGDAVRVIGLNRLGASTSVSVGAVSVDRLFGTVSILLMAVFGIGIAGTLVEPQFFRWAILIAAVGVLGTLALLKNTDSLASIVRWTGAGRAPTMERLAQRFLDALRLYRPHNALLTRVLLASMIVQALRSAQAWSLGLSIGLTIDGVWYFALIPLASLAFMLPASVSGLGAGTASFLPLFGRAGVTDADAVSLSLLFWFLGVLGSLPGGLLLLTRGRSTP